MRNVFSAPNAPKSFIAPLFLIPGILFLYVMLSNVFILDSAESRIFRSATDAPPRVTIIVLGARVYPKGHLSPMLADRMLTALDLYRQGKAERFLLSGDHGKVDYDEVNTMKDFLLNKGVAAKDIFLDHAGFDTYDSMYRARAIFEVRSAIVVTQGFHLARAVYTARAMGIDAVGVAADRQPYAGVAYNEAREVPARSKTFWRVSLHAKPRVLGDVIPITGDALKSWDQL